MKLRLAKIGRIAYPQLKELVQIYETRLKIFAKIESVELKDDEALKRLFEKRTAQDRFILLDEQGVQFSSRQFATCLERFSADREVKQLTLVVGGPLGLERELVQSADLVWSLSAATLTSDMAWLFCWEQVYRAFQIQKGTGYHHD